MNSANSFDDFRFEMLMNKILIASLKKEFFMNFFNCLKTILQFLI